MSNGPRTPYPTWQGGKDFRPLPLLGNAHVQTFLATLFQGSAFPFASRECFLALDDGDRLVLHDSLPETWEPGGPFALLVHGLTGSHQSGYVRRLGGLLLRRGVRVVRLDLRGCGRGEGLARRPYHAGCSDDLRAVAEEIHRWSPGSPLAIVGVSLGGNIALKLAGEAAEHRVKNLVCVAAVAPPIDLERCSARLTRPVNHLYQIHFLRCLTADSVRRQRFFPDLPVVRFKRGLTLRQFDDLYTAPLSGFADAQDYYHRAAALPLISRIQVPTLILTARDDPFIAVEPFLTLAAPPHVQVRLVDRGGHVGFLGWDGAGGIHWAERQVARWVLGILDPTRT